MLNPMDASVLLFETRAGRLTTPDSVWQFASKEPRPLLDRWVSKLWELDGTAPPAREQFGADYGVARESPSHSSKS